MSIEDVLTELLLCWEDDPALSPEDLCQEYQGHPEYAALLEAVKREMGALRAADAFLDTSQGDGSEPGPGVPEPPGLPAAGAALRPRYRPVAFHAKGGLGEVYRAEDEELHREVALKRIKEEYRGSAEQRRSFLREAEITAKLEHPGVVPVHGLQLDADGEPYYAMRFIRGESLDAAIKQFHEADKQPGRNAGERSLALRQLLNRFVAVCNTVAYAHSRGVLHRDLKPGNIMLGAYGETLVVDWGLAKPFERTEAERATGEQTLQPTAAGAAADGTLPGVAKGTPAYLSPEQADGRWDELGPASDVFGLGATLYALLTGQPPFTGRTVPEVVQRARRGEFPPPRQVKPDVPPALEAICRKAMALRPEDRYATALDLAADVERFLADEPVRAYREPWRARLGRWGRRHRPVVTGAVALLATAVVALAVGLVAVNAERRRTEQARAAEAKRRRQARQALDAMSSQVIDDWLAKQKELTGDQKQFLQKALASYEEFAQDTGQDEEARAGVARAYFRAGYIRGRLGELRGAEGAYRACVERYLHLAADYPAAASYRRDLATSHNNLGNLLRDTERAKEAEEEHRAALALRQRLADDDPGVPDYWRELAMSRNNLGNLLSNTGRAPQAQGELGAARDLYERLVADFPAVPDYRRGLAAAHLNLGNLFDGLGRVKQAEEEYRTALSLRQRLAEDFPAVADYRHELAQSRYNLGNLIGRVTGRGKEAEGEYREALVLYRRLAADFPAVPAYRQQLAKSHNDVGVLLKDIGRVQKAEGEYRTALAVKQRLADDYPDVPDYRLELAVSHQNLGNLLHDTGRLQEAEGEYRTALAVEQRLADEFPAVPGYRWGLALSHTSMGNLLHGTGRLREAEEEHRKALAQQQHLADNFPTVLAYRQGLATCHINLGALLKDAGHVQEAEGEYRAALTLLQQVADDFPAVPRYRQQLAGTHSNLGALLQDTGRMPEAEGEHQRALVLKQRLADGSPAVPAYRRELAQSHYNLANLLRDTGREKEAEAAFRTALELYRRLADDSPGVHAYRYELAGTLGNLANLLRGRQDFAGARRLLEEALPHIQAALRANPRHARYRAAFRNHAVGMALTFLGMGNHGAAADWAEQLAHSAVDPPNDLYYAACTLARCMPGAEKDAQLPEARRRELSREYADRAMAALRQAVGKGYKDLASLKKEPDLDPLRRRDDFQKLLADLEAKAGAR